MNRGTVTMIAKLYVAFPVTLVNSPIATEKSPSLTSRSNLIALPSNARRLYK